MRRTRGRGFIKQRAQGTWSVVVPLPKGPDGKRRQQWVTVKGTRKDAERKLTELLGQLDQGTFVKPSKLTVGDFLDQWLKDYVGIRREQDKSIHFTRISVREHTARRYLSIVENHLKPTLGKIELHKLTAAHVQACHATARSPKCKKCGAEQGAAAERCPKCKHQGEPKKGLRGRTLIQHHRVISEALSHAVKWGILARNVASAVDTPTADHLEMQVMPADTLNRALAAAQGTVWHPIFHLDAYTGMRRSEILALRWKDVDLTLGTISIHQVLYEPEKGRFEIDEPKTAKGKRSVSLSPAAVLALRAHRERQEADAEKLGREVTPASLVFHQLDGSPMHPQSVTQAWRNLRKDLGIEGVRLHDLRHTHATLLLKAGIHPKVVQERLGHASINITLDTYSHVLPGMQEAAALAFEGVLTEKPIEIAG